MSYMEGSEIKKFRQKHHLTQADLAELVGVKTGTVSKWESGIRNIGQSAIIVMDAYDAEKKNGSVANEKTPPGEVRFEDQIADKLLERLMPIVNKVLDSHQKIIKELLQQGLEIDELLDDVQELKETTENILKEVKELH